MLAHMVMLTHLWTEPSRHQLLPWAGPYAVFGFYLLSGYLMTLVLVRLYGFSAKGFFDFLANRILRIYPPYLVVLVGTSALIAWRPGIADVSVFLRFPTTIAGWLSNLAILGVDTRTALLVPTAWSLAVEVYFYLAMALLLTRHRWLALTWFGGSVAYTVYTVVAGFDFGPRYGPPQAASLAFATGALLFHFRERLRPRGQWHLPLAVLLLAGNAVAPTTLVGEKTGGGFYVSLAASAYLVACLAGIQARRAPVWLARVDRTLGDLSYPVFLCHFAVAGLLIELGFGGVRPGGAVLFTTSLPLVNVVAWFLHRLVEEPLEGLRSRIRRRASGQRGV